MVLLFGMTFPVIYVHLGTLAVAVVAILVADKAALSWVRGTRETLSPRFLHVLHWVVWVVLAVMIVSGVLLLQPLQSYLFGQAAFWIKMAFVAVLVINSFVISRYLHVATQRPFVSLTPEEKRPLLISGGASAVGWLGAFVAALFMTTSDWLVYFASQVSIPVF